jgi:hypothetical protein
MHIEDDNYLLINNILKRWKDLFERIPKRIDKIYTHQIEAESETSPVDKGESSCFKALMKIH